MAGTRTPINMDDFGGIDCLIQGEAILYINNQKPIKYSAPTCVYMPPGVRMMNVASGQVIPIFCDIFFGKKGLSIGIIQKKAFLRISSMTSAINRAAIKPFPIICRSIWAS